MRTLAALLGLIPLASAAAPVPNVPPAPTIEGKYTVLATSTVSGKNMRGGPGFAADPDTRGFAAASTLRRETSITKDSIVIDGRTATWEYRLDPSTAPMGIDLVIVPVLGKKTKSLGIVEQTGDRLKIAFAPEGADRPKNFDDTDGAAVYVFQKAPPPPRTEYRVIALKSGDEAEVEKKLNQLAKDGFEVAFTSTPPAKPGVPADPVTHLILKRTVK